MASADNKSNAEPNIEHECVRETVESIDANIAAVDKTNKDDASNTDPGESGRSGGPVIDNKQKDTDCQLSEENIRNKILRDLETLKNKLDTCTDIPPLLYDVKLNCLKPSTIDYLSYHLDPEGEILTADGRCKDYRGLAEWIGLETVFIKYVTRSSHLLKTNEVLSKWLTLEAEPYPNLKNLRQCLLDIERPDVLEDMSIKIALDAVSWKMTELEAQTERESVATDTSWQLTRHDVVSGKKTMYTACLLYADEDELMAQLIIKLYKSAYSHALFFLPQFDLKHGKYILDTTAKVIDERCDKKVVFLLSEYFYASQICQFAVNYAATHGTGHGNLIPFHLTRNVTSVPNVLKGIAGIRWFRKGTRETTWSILTESLLSDKITSKAEFLNVKDRIIKMVEKDKEYYLQDPPYDVDVGPPGEPIQVDEPEEASPMPLSLEFESKKIKLEDEMQKKQEKNTNWKFLTQIKKVIFEKVLRQESKTKNSLTPKPSSEIQMQTFKFIKTLEPNCEINDQELDDGMFGAVGGSNAGFNDLNVCSKSQSNDKKIVEPNVPQPKRTYCNCVTESCNLVCTQKIKNKQYEHDSSKKQSSYFNTKDTPGSLLPQDKAYC